MASTTAATTTSLARIRRSATDPKRSAEFYAWLLGLSMQPAGESFRLPCANGELVIEPNAGIPVAIELAGKAHFDGYDPDGVPVTVSTTHLEPGPDSVRLDHVSLNCADLAATIAFYRDLGFVLTWSGAPPNYENSVQGFQEQPVAGADWVHLSSNDGYIVLSQADWREYGIHNSESGPPRFIHAGFVVPDLDAIVARLNAAGIRSSRAPRDTIGDRLYLNDPDGDPRLGTNVELVQYVREVRRSGKPPY